MFNNENLSAFMDNEEFDFNVIKKLKQDTKTQEKWQYYHVIGDIMRGDAPLNIQWGVASKVRAMVDLESTYNIGQLPERKRQALTINWFVQSGQIAIAACVSLLVIFGIQEHNNSAGEKEFQPSLPEQLPVLQTIPFSGAVKPVSLQAKTRRLELEKQQEKTQDSGTLLRK